MRWRKGLESVLAGSAVFADGLGCEVNNQKVIKNMAYKIRWDFGLRLPTLQHTIHVYKIEPENFFTIAIKRKAK